MLKSTRDINAALILFIYVAYYLFLFNRMLGPIYCDFNLFV